MRLLYPRSGGLGRRAAEAQSASHARRMSCRTRRQSVPLRRLRQLSERCHARRRHGCRMTYKLLGQDFTPPDVFAKVTGTAKYAEDFRAEGMVFCRMLTSPMPHARVRSIDVSAALALPGVLGVLLPSEVTPVAEPNPPI